MTILGFLLGVMLGVLYFGNFSNANEETKEVALTKIPSRIPEPYSWRQ